MPQPGDRLWTPADWAWAGGLLNVLLPGLHYGVPVVAQKFEKFDPEEAFALMAEAGRPQRLHPADGAAHAALGGKPARATDCVCARVGSGGESLGAETYDWGREALGLTINEFYGQTECNLVLVFLRRDRRDESRARSASRCRATPSR